MQDDFLETLRNSFFFIYISVLLSWCLVSGSLQFSNTVELEIKAYRLQQFDFISISRGSRAWKVMYDAVSLKSNALRRCLIVDWKDLLAVDLNSVLGHAVGGALIILPYNIDDLSSANRLALEKLDRDLYSLNTNMAVYLTYGNAEIIALLDEVNVFSQKVSSATQQLFNSIAASTFQFLSSSSVTNNAIIPNAANIVGRLWASDRNSPTVVVVAHYDSHSAVPSLSQGADSNGSGVAALLELLAILSQFYASTVTRPKYNIVFLLSAGGKFNYQGSRQWIEDNIEKQPDHSIEMVICLDTIGNDNGLTVHVSKMPSDSSSIGKIYTYLKMFTSSSRTLSIISKKINLNADVLSWEHERFSIRRLPALTISRLKSHTDPIRTSLLDSSKQLNFQALEANINCIAEALLAYLLVLPDPNCTNSNNGSLYSVLNKDNRNGRVQQWIKLFGAEPRPLAGNNDHIIASLKDTVARLSSGHVTVEPVSLLDVSLYGVLEDQLVAHRVKPAIFELILALFISVYLFGIYFVALNIQLYIEKTLVKLKKS
ncbi:unnamed protein product [Dracunculus medinensis]|uniref:BOS complex subunit NCLN n=1 Tax=Dracunculus medinensis TaxID=318479 RepID=A0A0N4U8J1_DRAME|nr:unnamed protein product [Dracunculus medinensis]